MINFYRLKSKCRVWRKRKEIKVEKLFVCVNIEFNWMENESQKKILFFKEKMKIFFNTRTVVHNFALIANGMSKKKKKMIQLNRFHLDCYYWKFNNLLSFHASAFDTFFFVDERITHIQIEQVKWKIFHFIYVYLYANNINIPEQSICMKD